MGDGRDGHGKEVYFSQGQQKARSARWAAACRTSGWMAVVTTLGQREDRSYIQDNLPLT